MSLRRSFALLALVSSPLLLANCTTEEVADDAASGTNSTAGTPSSGSSGAAGASGGNAGSGGSSGSSAGGTGASAGAAGTLAGSGGSAGGGAAGASGSAGAGGTTAGSGSSGAGAGGTSAGGGSGGAGAGGAGAGGAGAGGAGAGGAAGSGGATGGGGSDSGVFTLTSSKLTPGEEMSADFTCEGDAHSPPFEWTGVPAGTVSFAMFFVDTTIAATSPDSAMAWHHAIWDIPAATTSLPEDMPTTATVTSPVMCKQFNPLSQCEGYLGPCANKEDTYEFRLYALPVATLTGTLNTVVAIRDAAMAANPLGEAILAVRANASGGLTCPKQ